MTAAPYSFLTCLVNAMVINEMVRRLIDLRRVGDLVGRFLRRIIDMQIRSVGISTSENVAGVFLATRSSHLTESPVIRQLAEA